MKVEKILPNIKVSDFENFEKYYTPGMLKEVLQFFTEAEQGGSNFRDNIPEDINRTLAVLKLNEDAFLYWVVGIYANIKPIYEDGKIVINKTIHPDNFSNIVFRDKEYSSDDVMTLFKFFRTLNWSDYTSKSQTKAKTFNSAVPLFLYAQKLHNDIPYSSFRNATQGQLGTLLGKAFAKFPIEATKVSGGITNLRQRMVTGKMRGEPHLYPFNAYKYNKTGNIEFDELPPMLRMMLAQIWIFNSQCRNNRMILDWADWDNVPDSFDESIRLEKISPDDIVF